MPGGLRGQVRGIQLMYSALFSAWTQEGVVCGVGRSWKVGFLVEYIRCRSSGNSVFKNKGVQSDTVTLCGS